MSHQKPRVYCFYSNDQVDPNNFGDAGLFIEKSAYDDLKNEMRVELGHAGLELEGYRMWTNQLRADLDLAIEALQKLQAGYAGMFGSQSVSAKDEAWKMAPKIVDETLAKLQEIK